VSATSPHIRLERRDDGVGVLRIDRPEKKGAMTYSMLHAFHASIASAGRDDDVRVLVVTGAGGAFCAGTDLSELQDTDVSERGSRGSAEPQQRRPTGVQRWPLLACPKPTIAAVDGPAVGMGAEFTSQCDLRVASDRARFAWNFAHRGLVPDTGAGSWLLPRLVGVSQALRLLYTGEFLTAADALELGYVSAVVPPEQLEAEALALAGAMAQSSPFSQRHIKSLVYQGLAGSLDEHLHRHDEALAACFASEDHREGVASFLERRPARFTGR
jgi:enoyl-CoA hydratase/carnithine racemase